MPSDHGRPLRSEMLELIEAAAFYPLHHRRGHEPVGSGYNRLPESTKQVLRKLKSEDLANVRIDRLC